MAFRTHEFFVMPFDLENAPTTFQSLMKEVFRPFLRNFVLVSLMIFSYVAERRSIIKIMWFLFLKPCRSTPCFLMAAKAVWGNKGSLSWSYYFSSSMEVDPENISAIINEPVLKNIKEIRGFLGLTGYYHR